MNISGKKMLSFVLALCRDFVFCCKKWYLVFLFCKIIYLNPGQTSGLFGEKCWLNSRLLKIRWLEAFYFYRIWWLDSRLFVEELLKKMRWMKGKSYWIKQEIGLKDWIELTGKCSRNNCSAGRKLFLARKFYLFVAVKYCAVKIRSVASLLHFLVLLIVLLLSIYTHVCFSPPRPSG